jgi:putative aldouronate transport system substrate-binding protein
MKRKSSILALFLVLAMMLSMLAACGSSTTTSTSTETETAADTTTEETSASPEASEATTAEDTTTPADSTEEAQPSEEPAAAESEIQLPLTEDLETFTVWAAAAPFYAGKLEDLGDIYILSVLEENTNVHLEYTTISFTAETESFGVMVASGDYTDIINKGVDLYSKSADDAIDQEILIDLTDLIANYCPNLQARIDSDEDISEGMITAGGRIAAFPVLYNEAEPGPSNGLGIRQDWLDALGLDTPTTYDQLHDVLVQFKEAYNATMFIPQDGVNVENMLASGYGIDGNVLDDGGLYVVDGVIKSALMEDGYKDFLTMLNTWYEEGLIDPDFVTYSDEFINSHTEVVTTGRNGVASIDTDSFVTLKDASSDPDFNMMPLADLTLNEGETLHFGQKTSAYGGNSWSITTACQNPELITEYVNYLFSDEGIFLTNYGTEGYTFEYSDDGTPVYTDFIANNPDTDMFLMLLTQLAHTGSPFPYEMIYDRTYYMLEDVQIEARYVWSSNTDYAYVIPSAVTLTTEESERFNDLFSDISTCASENVMKFITGARSLDEYDSFKSDLLQMGLEDMVALYQAAYDRGY